MKASKEVHAAFEHAMAMRVGLEIAQRAAGVSANAATLLAVKECGAPNDVQITYNSQTEEVSWMEWPA